MGLVPRLAPWYSNHQSQIIHKIIILDQECPLYAGYTVQHPLGWVPRVSFICRFHCTTSTRLGPKSVLYVQVPLYNIHQVGSQECPLYAGYTVQHPLGWVPRVSFICRFHCTTSTRLSAKSVLYMQVPVALPSMLDK